MSRERYDTGIDWLRLAAAILVIAIHTSPLADFSETGKNVDDIVEAVKTGKELDGYRLTLGDVQFCVTNLLRVVAKVMK